MSLSPWLPFALVCACSSTPPDEPAPISEPATTLPNCGRALPSSPTADALALQSDLDFASCGRQQRPVDGTCCSLATEGYDCLVAALAACVPTRLEEVASTVEGAAFFADYFVVPTAKGCDVVLLTDDGEDRFRDPTRPAVSARQCGVAQVAAPANGEGCARLQLDDCGP